MPFQKLSSTSLQLRKMLFLPVLKEIDLNVWHGEMLQLFLTKSIFSTFEG